MVIKKNTCFSFSKNGYSCESHWKGRLSYTNWLSLQDECLNQSIKNLKSFVFGVEHESTVTLGISVHKNLKEEIFISKKELKSKGIQVIKVFRGGKTTLHSPGQLMVYPIFHLHHFKLTLKAYIDLLFQVTIRFLKIYGISSVKGKNNPGIYTKKGKIAFLGLRVNQGVSSYGLAINVSNDLSLFSFIRSCGRETESFDAMKNYGISLHLKDLFSAWVFEFFNTLNECNI